MHSIESWLHYNNLSAGPIHDIIYGSIDQISSSSSINRLLTCRVQLEDCSAKPQYKIQDFIDQVIAKAFAGFFADDEVCIKTIASIEFETKKDSAFDESMRPPFAIDRGKGDRPLVSLGWNGSAGHPQ